ncbi:integrase core domain-containing protein [Delftia acidovorans]|uniref:integrase core domain-containing protein n=1 Tax=Delftia acidovorans TaxID=80866 RepID=UPI001E2ADA53|nr:integrase core domain-containing protein [Delftia acidovorans]
MVERVIRTLKDPCVHRHRLETLQHARRVIADWIGLYNHRRPHQAGDEDPRRGICFSRLTCAETAGSIHPKVAGKYMHRQLVSVWCTHRIYSTRND